MTDFFTGPAFDRVSAERAARAPRASTHEEASFGDFAPVEPARAYQEVGRRAPIQENARPGQGGAEEGAGRRFASAGTQTDLARNATLDGDTRAQNQAQAGPHDVAASHASAALVTLSPVSSPDPGSAAQAAGQGVALTGAQGAAGASAGGATASAATNASGASQGAPLSPASAAGQTNGIEAGEAANQLADSLNGRPAAQGDAKPSNQALNPAPAPAPAPVPVPVPGVAGPFAGQPSGQALTSALQASQAAGVTQAQAEAARAATPSHTAGQLPATGTRQGPANGQSQGQASDQAAGAKTHATTNASASPIGAATPFNTPPPPSAIDMQANAPLADTLLEVPGDIGQPLFEEGVAQQAAKADAALAAKALEAPQSMRTAGPRVDAAALASLAAKLATRTADGSSRFEIRMDPPELGRVSVRLEVDSEGVARAHLAAERPETYAELARQARALERALAEAGVRLADAGLTFSLADQNTAGGQARDDAPDLVASPNAASQTREPETNPLDHLAPGDSAEVDTLYGFSVVRRGRFDLTA